LGGHSVLLAQVSLKLRDAFGREVPILDLFKYPTVSSLAEYLSQEPDEAADFEASQQRAAGRRANINRRQPRQVSTPHP
jgi:hypothetical protein